jgi:hypothetical protein
VSSYLALQNDSAGDLQNRRVRAIHGRRIRVGPGSARPASMEGERPMPPRIYAPQPPWKGRVRCRPGSERPELQEGVADGGARPSEAVGHAGRSTCFSRLPCQGPWRYIGSGEVVVATPSRTPTLDLNPTGASRAVPEEDHMASKAACKRRMGITRGWSCLGGQYQRGGYRGPSIVRAAVGGEGYITGRAHRSISAIHAASPSNGRRAG